MFGRRGIYSEPTNIDQAGGQAAAILSRHAGRA